MSLQLVLVRGLYEIAGFLALLAVGIGLFVTMPDAMLQSDYLKALVPAVLVVLASAWSRWRHPEAQPSRV